MASFCSVIFPCQLKLNVLVDWVAVNTRMSGLFKSEIANYKEFGYFYPEWR